MRVRSISTGILLVGLACQTTVEGPVQAAVALHIAPSLEGPFVVNVGTDIVLFAIPVAADSAKLGSPIAAAWSSSDTAIATVNSEGRVHTRCIGTAIISAAANQGGRTVRGSRIGPTCA